MAVLLLALVAPLQAGEWKERFIDDEDGKLDISDYLANPGSFLLIPIIVTEPAVGFGAGFGAVFLQPREDAGEAGWRRPDITGAGALRTENGTKGGGAFDLRHWRDGTLKSKAGALATSVNLDVYGLESGSGDPVSFRYNLDVKGGMLGLEQDTPLENLSIQLSYAYLQISAKLADQELASLSLPTSRDEDIGSLAFSLIYDSRNNLFSPSEGLYSKTEIGVIDETVGATTNFQKLSQTLILYQPLREDWVLGLKLDGQAVFGDVPFYAKPFVSLRGVPAMRYQGEYVAFGEMEVQHQLSKRFRLVGFAGAGYSWDDFGPINLDQSVFSGGVGFRYRLARKFGLDMGIDIATSGDDSAIYLQMGSAWLRM